MSRGIVLGVVAFFCAVEVAFRVFEGWLSVDLRHITEIPDLVEDVAEGPGLRIVFLGNSLTREGVSPQVFLAESEKRGLGPLSIARVYPDDSRIGEWIYVFEHYFADPGRLPDVLVVGFARGHLVDGHRLALERIAAFYTDLSDIPETFRSDVHRFEERAEFLLAHASRAFALRERVRRRVLEALIPDYRRTSRVINESLRVAPAGQNGNPTYARLGRMASRVREHGVKLILVAMPLPRPYELDPAIRDLATRYGARVLDLRTPAGVGPDVFRDGLHLNARGAELYTRGLAEELAALLQEDRASVGVAELEQAAAPVAGMPVALDVRGGGRVPAATSVSR